VTERSEVQVTGTDVVRYVRLTGSAPHTRTDAWVLVGQDGGQSVDIGGETLFLFSDTLLAPLLAPATAQMPPFPFDINGPCYFLANCAGIASGTDLRGALDGMRYLCDGEGIPALVVEPTRDEHRSGLRFWPLHGIWLHGRVYLYYIGIQATGASTMWDFRNRGIGIAVLDPGSGQSERMRHDGDWRLWQPSSDDLHFGVQILAHGGHLYVFGSRRRGFDTDGFVGWVAADDIADPAAYRFAVPGGQPVADLHEAGSLGPCGSDYSVSFNAHLGRYLMLYVDGFTKRLMLRLGDDIVGPYSAPVVVGGLPHLPSSELIYMAVEHPGFARDGGRRVAISYCQPSFTPNSLVEVGFR
jgi:Domain of unknown function (DUF4185)